MGTSLFGLKPKNTYQALLKTTANTAIDATLRTISDGLGNDTPLQLSLRRVGVLTDTSVVTQVSSVIQASTLNASLVIAPNGTGALVANIPDGAATGGNARGQYAVDLQIVRGFGYEVASGTYSFAAGFGNNASGAGSIAMGQRNTASQLGSTAIGGGGGAGGGVNATAQFATAVGGYQNNASGTYSGVFSGTANTVSSNYGVVTGGQGNTASTNGHATVVGGQNNTASGAFAIVGGQGNTASGNYAVVVGGQSNTASGQYAIAGGFTNTASGSNSICIGDSGAASGFSSITLGANSSNSDFASAIGGRFNRSYSIYGVVQGGVKGQSYLYNQLVTNSNSGITDWSDTQNSQLLSHKTASLTTGGTTVLSLDGTGVTNLIIPLNNNRAWNVQVNWVAIVTTITGTATGITVGDVITSIDLLAFKKIGGISSASAHTSTATKLMVTTPAAYAACAIAYTAGASQEMALTFTAPTFVGGGSVTMRVVARIELAEVAF
jgi:hypothetical protein